jgi:hypothetical protein
LVSAGSDQTVALAAGATLAGAVTDDGLPNPPGTVTTLWSKVDGPGVVTFADQAAASTTATFATSGTYVLRLRADDNELFSIDDVTITVTESVPSSGIRREASSTVVNTTATNTVTIPIPSGTAPGDALVTCLALNGGSVAATGVPAGWTPIASVTSISNPHVFGYYRVAGSSEPAGYTWTLGSAVASGAGMTRYSGVSLTSPLDAAPTKATGAAATAGTIPGLTTVTGGAMVVGCMSVNSGNTSVTIGSPPGLSQTWDIGGKRLELADGPQASPGTTGDKVWTFSASREWAGWLVALRPQ